MCRATRGKPSPQFSRASSAVIDLAGISNDPACDLDPKITEDVNFCGSCHSAGLAKAAGVPRYIYSSSCSIYGHGSGEALGRNLADGARFALCADENPDRAELLKLDDENFAVTLMRNATVYGLSRRMRFDLVINIMTLHAYKNRKIYIVGGGKQWRPLIHVRDVARAFLSVLEAPREKVAGRGLQRRLQPNRTSRSSRLRRWCATSFRILT